MIGYEYYVLLSVVWFSLHTSKQGDKNISLQDFYKQFHAYVRAKLRDFYKDQVRNRKSTYLSMFLVH